MVYFFSYGDSNYRNSKERIFNEAKNFGFDDVKVYGPENISKEFYDKTSPHISHSRGCGYWLWKSFFLKNTFDKMKDNDICVYADAGCHVNIHGKKRFQEYIDMINKNETGILSFDLGGFLEKMYTNEKAFEYFNIEKDNEYVRGSGILMATIMIMRKCDHTVKLIDEYYKIALESPEIFSDIYNEYKRTPEFRDHRHDQSIFSILRKLRGSVVIPDETYAINWNDLIEIPILSTRIRG